MEYEHLESIPEKIIRRAEQQGLDPEELYVEELEKQINRMCRQHPNKERRKQMENAIKKLSGWVDLIEFKINEQGYTPELMEESRNAFNLAKWLVDECINSPYERKADELQFRLFSILWRYIERR